jgi:hypothetical protein
MNNKKIGLKTRVILYLFFCWTLSNSVNAQPSETSVIPERVLPETTLAVWVFPNLQETVEAFKQTLLFERFRSESIVGLIQQNLTLFAEQFQQNAGFTFADLWSIFHRSITVALLDLSENVHMPQPYPEFVLIADVTGALESLKNLLETKIIPRIQTKEPTVEFFVESFAGVNLYVLANKQFQLYYAFLENKFIVAFKLETIQKLITVAMSETTGNLSRAAAYRSVISYLPEKRHEARLYVDIQHVWQKLRPYLHRICSRQDIPENPIILDLIDHYPLQNLFWTFSYQDKGGYERLFLKSQNPDFGKRPSDVGNGVLTSDQLVPANVLYYGAARINLSETWRQLSALINASPDPQQHDLFTNWVKRIEEALHLNIEQDLLSAFGEELAFAWYAGEFRRKFTQKTSELEEFPLFALLQVKDPQKVAQAFQTMGSTFQIESHREVYQNTTIQTLLIPGQITPFTVYTALIKDFLLVSVSQTIMQEVIAVSQYGSSLATTENYRQLSASFPSTGYAKGYLNLQQLSKRIQHFLRQGNQLESSFGNKIFAQIFDSPTFTDQLSGMMWVTTVVSDGFVTESYSPMGGIVTGTALAWFGLRSSSLE